MPRIDSFLRLVVDQGASDLHFHSGKIPTIRHDGDLVPLPFRALSPSEARRLLCEFLPEAKRDTLARDQELDLIYVLEGVGRFRANLFVQRCGYSGVFRIIPQRMPTIDELLLPPIIRQLARYQNGLILVTGPTGSGKTTTLAAIVNEINLTAARHIITIEDPIEWVHEPKHCMVSQRQVGEHSDSFASALRSALRESPDVLVVGEMRDLETITIALQAAETGVLVFGSLHTNSACKAVDRILDVVTEESRERIRGLLSVLLRGVISQHLLKRASGEGRIAAMEILLSNFAVANLIRENKTHQLEGYLDSVANEQTGMQSLDQCLTRYVKAGWVTLEEALLVANYPETVRRAGTEAETYNEE